MSTPTSTTRPASATSANAYLSWLKAQGTRLSPTVQLRKTADSGYGLYVDSDAAAIHVDSGTSRAATEQQGSTTADCQGGEQAWTAAVLPAALVLTAERIHAMAWTHWPVLHAWLIELGVCSSDHTLEQNQALEGTADNLDEEAERHTLMAFLIHHARVLRQEREQNCPLLPYVRWLPSLEEMNRPVQWTRHAPTEAIEADQPMMNALDWLEGSPLAEAVCRKEKRLQTEGKEWQQYSRYARERLADASVSTGLDSTLAADITLDEMRWADAIYWSRVLEVPFFSDASNSDDSNGSYTLRRALLPLIDMCNHAGENTNARWQVMNDGAVKLCVYGRQLSATKTTSPVQLLYSYGDKPNAELLFNYGFALEDNAVDETCPIVAPLLAGGTDVDEDGVDWLLPAKRQLMKQWSMSPIIQLKRPTGQAMNGVATAATGNSTTSSSDILSLIGWSALLAPDALSLMYLCVLTADELSVSPTSNGLQWQVCGDPVEHPNDLEKALASHEMLGVAQLRAVLTIDAALEAQAAQMRRPAELAMLLRKLQNMDTDTIEPVEWRRLRWAHVYLSGFSKTLHAARDWLAAARDLLYTDQSIVSFLDQFNSTAHDDGQ
ncbi:hypothetical protein THASP1DRAFT_31745 [Thamnocephalis sphaerospora]|uniref:SET domain-containing protein n=1 Tax=Thamnocephalis sphaerospora TaxID=78915 RepID=A0A4P9XKU3_9FUNG|nr:hypothetical protein THASP1DRAFT_31745 [Thamnocephalis sphaerospora]|eukprot:RKP06443.1 hypothetical protein THASP1DRAFT_31745 [Thamnocephalis sphaerospora]